MDKRWLELGCLCLVILTLSCGAIAAADPVAVPRLRVDAREQHTLDPRLFGQFLERPSWGETGPEFFADAQGRLPAEIIGMLRDMRIPIVRFPGGTDIDYMDWTDMVANVPGRAAAERPVSTGHTGEKVTNRFGYDEYFRLAGELRWDTILVVNFLDALAKRKPLADAARHAAGLVAYVNAPVGAKLPAGMPDWPALRAKNGHPEPYGVKIVQIGNEWWCGRFPQEVKKACGGDDTARLAPWYRECIIAYADALRAVDPTIDLIIDARLGAKDLDEAVLADPEIRKRVLYAALHRYAPWGVKEAQRDGASVPLATLTPAESWLALAATPGCYEAGICTAFGDGLRVPRDLGYKIVATEWNWNGWVEKELNLGPGVDWRHAAAIGAAGFLHGLLRQGDAVSIANQSMLLGHRWGIAAIMAAKEGKFPVHYNAQGAVTTFYNRHHGGRLLALVASGVPSLPQPYTLGAASPIPQVALLDALATRREKAVFVHVINRALDTDLSAEIDLTTFKPADGPALWHLLEPVPLAQLQSKKVVMAERRETALIAAGTVRLTFPPRTISILEVSVP